MESPVAEIEVDEREEVRAGGVEGAVRKEDEESFEKCCSEEGRGGFFGRLYCFGDGISYYCFSRPSRSEK